LHTHAPKERSLLWSELIELGRNREYLLLVASFSIGLGLVNAVLTLVFQLVGPVGYTNADAGWFSFILIMVGMVSSGGMAVVLEKTRAYRTIYTYGFVVCWGSMIFFCYMLFPNNYLLLCVAFGFMGSTIIPLFPACLENTAECTYPVSEEISVGVLLTAGNIGTIVITGMFSVCLSFLIFLVLAVECYKQCDDDVCIFVCVYVYYVTRFQTLLLLTLAFDAPCTYVSRLLSYTLCMFSFFCSVLSEGLQAMIEASSFSSSSLPWNLANIASVTVLSLAAIFALMYQGDSKRLRADHAGQEQERGQGQGPGGFGSGSGKSKNPILSSRAGDGEIEGLSQPLLQ